MQISSLLRFDTTAGLEANAARLMARGAPALGLIAGICVVVWWPLDLLIFDAFPETLRAFAIFRVGAMAFCLGTSLLLPRFHWVRRHPALVTTTVIALLMGWIAYWMASTDDGGWNSLAFLYLAPWTTLVVLVPLKQRALSVAAVTAAVPLGWFLNPASPLTRLSEFITLSYSLFAAATALAVGHALWLLLEANYAQAEELAAQRQELAAAARDLGKRVAERTAALRELRKHAQAAREQERRALGRDLHDGLGQELVAMRLAVSMARQSAGEDAGLEDALELVDRQAVASQAALRELLADFRAALLDELGLVPAVRAMALEVGHGIGLNVDFDASELEGDVRSEAGIALFRVAQEGLNNIRRHAQADNVLLRFSGDDGAIRLEMQDDGVGMPDGGVPADRYGLAGMRERVELLGGTLEVGNGERGGVTVKAEVPRQAHREPWAEPSEASP
ncbi:MAG: sensor histidine kinase [Deltaproteobacteria bacterium]|nr:sensor histidine kinase [Deltaproteobacteria bacterium]